MTTSRKEQIQSLQQDWQSSPRWQNVTRTYDAETVVALRGSVQPEHVFSQRGSRKLWDLLHEEPFVSALGALTGAQAVQQVKAGLKAIYLSGWQVAADANGACEMYPDQSLYPVDSVPTVVKRVINAFRRADQIQWAEGQGDIDFFAPIVADAEAGFGGVLNTFELTRNLIAAGAAAIHLEDQMASLKKCGHMGGKVLVPTREAIEKLTAARLAAESAGMLISNTDPYDRRFLTGERSTEGFFYTRPGLDQAIARGLAYAPYADLVWCETARPDLAEAKRFAESIQREYPDQLLAYNCSPSFNWKQNLDDTTIAKFQTELGAMGYKFQFITLAGFHSMNYSMFQLSREYAREQMTAYVRLQQEELAAEELGYTATRHQREVGAGYFDRITQAIQGGQSSTTALTGSTEARQFEPVAVVPA